MKILGLADLHMVLDPRYDVYRGDYQKEVIIPGINNTINKNPDIAFIVIAGDVFEDVVDCYRCNEINADVNPFTFLHKMCPTVPIVFCLGNHEFANSSIDLTHRAFAHSYDIFKTAFPEGQVYCLDLCGKYTTVKEGDKVNVVGNVLWYDGLCSDRADREKLLNEISDRWLDHSIRGFNATREAQNCVKQIRDNLIEDCTNILVTHCVPHRDLNAHDPNSFANVYSGFGNLFKDHNIKVDWAICGHTHLPVSKEIIVGNYSVNCINVGQDYFNGLKHRFIET